VGEQLQVLLLQVFQYVVFNTNTREQYNQLLVQMPKVTPFTPVHKAQGTVIAAFELPHGRAKLNPLPIKQRVDYQHPLVALSNSVSACIEIQPYVVFGKQKGHHNLGYSYLQFLLQAREIESHNRL
jgi:hypothetical protein